MSLAGSHFAFLVRLIQFGLGLAAVWIATRAAGRLFGTEVERPALLLLLFSPTLVYATTMLLTETLEILLFAIVFYCFVRAAQDRERGEFRKSMTLGGCFLGLATLTRWPAPALIPAGAFLCWLRRDWKALSLLVLGWFIFIFPWLVRNYRVFGTATLSTLGGIGLVKGVLDPQGRGIGGADDQVRAALGWTHQEYERNDRTRAFPSELQMDRDARDLWFRLIWERKSELPGLVVRKLSWFWLSLDQIEDTSGLGRSRAWGRAAFAVIWWLYLGLAAVGLYQLSRFGDRQTFGLLLFWFILATIAHLPFCMNTRLRSCFVDAEVAVLAAAGVKRMRPLPR